MLNKFELDIMNMLLSGEHEVLAELDHQFTSSVLLSREYTGVGMYLQFSVPSSYPKVNEKYETKDRFWIGDLGGRIGVPAVEIGCIVWVNNGYLSTLEGHTYGNDRWPEKVGKYELYYLCKSRRDLDSIVSAWESKNFS
jgi:hypothetical protein